MVAVKTINPESIENFNAFKRVRLPSSQKHLLSTQLSVWVHPEAVQQRGHMEATTISKCSRFPWVRLRLPSILSRLPLDVQRQFVRVLARAPRCR